MPKGPAARIMDPVLHPLPPVLQPGPGSVNVIIGGMLAWRGVPARSSACKVCRMAGKGWRWSAC